MKKLFTAIAMLAIVALISLPVSAQSLYEQEGTIDDGYAPINATDLGPGGPGAGVADSKTNWKYQYGGGTWTGVYQAGGWYQVNATGDQAIEVECDIEMFYTDEIADNKVYFHLGDPYNATTADRTALVTGSMTYNNGMYVGISFDGTGKNESDLEDDGSGGYTGRVFGAMIGSVDVLGRDISSESFDAEILLDWGSGYQPPITFGTGASGTILNTLWWLVDDGNPGSYNYTWRIRMLPAAAQPDGNYEFDPIIVAAPML